MGKVRSQAVGKISSNGFPGADSLQRNEKRKKFQVQEEITKNQYLRAGA